MEILERGSLLLAILCYLHLLKIEKNIHFYGQIGKPNFESVDVALSSTLMKKVSYWSKLLEECFVNSEIKFSQDHSFR